MTSGPYPGKASPAASRQRHSRSQRLLAYLLSHATWIALGLILIIAALLRIAGQDWDGYRGWYPDADYVAQRALAMRWPGSISAYFDSANSTFNPRNHSSYWTFGTFPLFLGKALATLSGANTYNEMAQLFRSLSAAFDVLSVALLFLIGRRVRGPRVGLVAALLYALSPIAIQLSHFGFFDTAATALALATFYVALLASDRKRAGWFVLAGCCAGFAMASVYPFQIVLVLLAIPLIDALRSAGGGPDWTSWLRQIRRPVLLTVVSVLVALLAFRLVQPYAFAGPGFFGLHWDERWTIDTGMMRGDHLGWGETWQSPQWALRVPVLYSFLNLILRGLGPVLGIVTLASLALLLGRLAITRRTPPTWLLFLVGWPLLVALVNGRLFMQEVRLLLPAVPFLVLIAVLELDWLAGALRRRWPSRVWIAAAPLAVVLVATALSGLSMTSIFAGTPNRETASAWIFANVDPQAGLLVEENDVVLPVPMQGLPAQSDYRITTLPIYDVDSAEKLDTFIEGLRSSEYVVLSSNRGDMLPRVIEKYPMMQRYYAMLRDGSLGFEQVATFSDAPLLLGESIATDQLPLEFNVYDHPEIAIYRKTNTFDANQARDALSASLEQPIVDIRSSIAGYNMLMFSDADWQTQRAGGTWSALFDRDSLANRHPIVIWYLALQLIGLLALPVTWRLLRHLPDRGYAASKPLGLLFVSTIAWLLGSYHLVEFGRGSVWISMGVLLVVTSFVLALSWREMLSQLRANWRWIVATELVFLIAYGSYVFTRWRNPDIWHLIHPGEKHLDFIYFNAVIKSSWFPAYDPWFSGGTLNYYYLGHVPNAFVSILTGIVPASAFNLALTTCFAFAMLMCWSIVANLVALSRGISLGRSTWIAIAVGLLGVLFYGVVGNLDLARRVGLDFYASIPLPAGISGQFGSFGDLALGVWRSYAHFHQNGWDSFWYPTRVIPKTINEFPAFTFLFADLHPHLLVMPYSLLAVLFGVSLAALRRSATPSSPPSTIPGMHAVRGWIERTNTPALRDRLLVLTGAGLVTGAVYPMNPWSYPTAMGITGVSLLVLDCVGSLRAGERSTETRWTIDFASLRRATLSLLFVAALGRVIYQPFYASYQSPVTGLVPTPEQSPLGGYLIIFGLFLFFIVAFMVLSIVSSYPRTQLVRQRSLPVGYLVAAALGGAIAVAIFIRSIDGFLWSLVALGVVAIFRTRRDPLAVYLFSLSGLAIALSLFVERWALRGDQGRLNTVFKLHLDVWMIVSLVAAVCLYLTARDALRRRYPRALSVIWAAGGVFLLLAALVYPLTTTRARIVDRGGNSASTIDGSAYMADMVWQAKRVDSDPLTDVALSHDQHAIEWMQDNIDGSPVILEAFTPPYGWGWRVSVYTGLPTILGVLNPTIMNLQRPDYFQFYDERVADIQTILGEARSFENIQPLLDKYQVEYIYIGPLERIFYDEVALRKFEVAAEKGLVEIVYDQDDVTIYKYVPAEPAT